METRTVACAGGCGKVLPLELEYDPELHHCVPCGIQWGQKYAEQLRAARLSHVG